MYFKDIKRLSPIFKDGEFAYYYFVKNIVRIAKLKFLNYRKRKGTIIGKSILNLDESNNTIYKMLIDEEPCMIARNGGGEIDRITYSILLELGYIDDLPEEILRRSKINIGIFPATQEVVLKFAEEYKKAISNADMTAYWGHILCEDYMIKHFELGAQLYIPRALEPFTINAPWTLALRNKKVLVIHPFAKLIEQQYKQREKLFVNQDVLPQFELKTLDAINSSGDSTVEFKDWFEVLNFMSQEIENIDFDIAILGCGGYAVPLASKIKNMGKKAIVLGGLTQLLFGIKGSRWEESRPDIVDLYNEYWIRAGDYQKIKGFEKIENGAYW